MDPPDQSDIALAASAPTTRVIISAAYGDDRAVDVKSVRLVVDGQDVTRQALISDRGLSYPADVGAGPHTVLLEARDTTGNRPRARGNSPWVRRLWKRRRPRSHCRPVRRRSWLRRRPTVTATPVPLPVINSFTANETTVPADRPVLLTWSVSNADIVFLNQDRVDLVGSRLVALKTTTTFHLIANNSSGTMEKAITVTVLSQPDLTVTDINVGPAGQLNYVIKNIGSGDLTRMFLIQVFVDGVPVDSNRRIASLSVQQEVAQSVPNYTLVGAHTVTVRVNGTQEVAESNYANNELTRALVGPMPTPTNTALPTPTPLISSTPTPILATATSTRTRTPTATVAPVGVTNVIAALGSTSPYTGTCPGNFTINGMITTNGATTVVFQWERSDGAVNGPFSVVFSGPMTQVVPTQWLSAPVGALWVRLRVLTPNPNNLGPVTVNFQNSCK